MQYLANYHTHTNFCDGAQSPSEMARAAFDAGLQALGFSSHAMYPYAGDCHIPLKDYAHYIEEINALKNFYAGKMHIFAGFEVEYAPVISVPDKALYKNLGADYIIASVHYVCAGKNQMQFAVDNTADELKLGMEKYFAGNGKKLVECYYEHVREMIKTCTYDFVGHVDVIRKRNGVLKFFDEDANWYKKEIKKTAIALADAHAITEINTGGIARKALDDVYPSTAFLKELFDKNVPIIINSDAHCSKDLCCAFDKAEKFAKQAGYKKTMHLFCKDGVLQWSPCPL